MIPINNFLWKKRVCIWTLGERNIFNKMSGFVFDFDDDTPTRAEAPQSAVVQSDRIPTTGVLIPIGANEVTPDSVDLMNISVTFPQLTCSPSQLIVADPDSAMRAGVTASDTWARTLDSTDIVPGQYEGGFRVWSGAPLLAGIILSVPGLARGRHVLEIGCGHALPSVAALIAGAHTVVCQDLNTAVIRAATAATFAANAPHLHLPADVVATCSPAAGLMSDGASAPAPVGAGAVSANAVIASSAVQAAVAALAGRALLVGGPWCAISRASVAVPCGACAAGAPHAAPQTTGVDFVIGSDVSYTDAHAYAAVEAALRAVGVGVPAAADAAAGVSVASASSQWVVLIATKTYYFGTGGGTAATVDAFEKLCGARRLEATSAAVGTGFPQAAAQGGSVTHRIAELIAAGRTAPVVGTIWEGGPLSEEVLLCTGPRA